MKSIRIKDIAQKAKVSTGTVDRVLHNRGRVSDEIKERVLKVAEEMNYEPNLMARALVSTKIYQIAVLIPDYRIDPYWEDHQKGIKKAEKELKKYKVAIHQFLFNPYDVQSFIDSANLLTASNPDGIFLPPIFYRETLPFFDKWKEQDIPFIFFNTDINESGRLSYIGQDSYLSGFLAGRLVTYGQPDPCSILIAHIDEETGNATHLIKKEQGFRDFFVQNLLSDQYHILREELNCSDFAKFNAQLDYIFQNTPDLKSVFVTSSKAFEIAAYLEQRGMRNIKIIGYDLIPKNIVCLNKGFISFLINQNPAGQGYWGVQYLARHLVFKKAVPSLKYLPLDVVTKENQSYYTQEEESTEA